MQGFTLIELLVVAGIIAMLSVVGVVIFTGVQGAARDARRKTDIQSMAQVLEVNYKGAYFPLTDAIFASGKIPSDPGGKSYSVDLPAGGGYRVCAALEQNPASTCSVPLENMCFCIYSQQDVYAPPEPTPEPTPISSPTCSTPPAPTPSPDTGKYWKDRGLAMIRTDAIAVDPANSNNVYFGNHDVGFLKSISGGNSFKMSNASLFGYSDKSGGNVFAIAIDPASSNIIYDSNNTWNSTPRHGLVSKSIDYGESWTTIGSPDNGLPDSNIYSISLDPGTCVSNRTIYVASRDNGIYKTTNGGTSWTAKLSAANIGIGQSNSVDARAVVVDPNNPQTIFAGFLGVDKSGQKDAQENYTIPSILGGVYKSINDGTNWTKVAVATDINTNNAAASVNSIAIDPNNSTIYAATYYLRDRGTSSPSNHPNRDYYGGIIRSTDGGVTWTQVLNLSTPPFGVVSPPWSAVSKYSVNATSVIVNKNSDVYVSFSNEGFFDEYRAYGVFKSTDRGTNWSQINTGLSSLNIWSLAIDPANLNTIYAGSIPTGAFRTTDGGGNWVSIDPGGGGYMPAVVIVPNATDASRIIFGGSNVGGFYKSTNNGQSFQVLNSGLKNYDVEGIVYDPGSPNTIYLATPGGPYKSTDGGANWVQKRTGFPAVNQWGFSKPLSAIAMAPDPQTLYVGVGRWSEDRMSSGTGEIWKSFDGAENWAKVNTGASNIDPAAAITKIAVDQNNSNNVYAVTDKGMYKSTDAGVNWTARNSGLPNYEGTSTPYVRNVVIDPNNSNTIYTVLFSKPSTASTKYPWWGGVYKSTDGGINWSAKISGLAPTQAEINATDNDYRSTRNYKDLVIDPTTNPPTLYLGSTAWRGAGVWQSLNGGDTWTQKVTNTAPSPSPRNFDNFPDGTDWHGGGGLPAVGSLAIDTLNPNVLFFGTYSGFFATFNRGNYWYQVNSEKVIIP